MFAVEDNEKILIEDFAGLFGAFDEHAGDGLGVFVARIVLGDDDDVAVLAENFATRLAGGMIAFTGATVDRDDFRFVALWLDTGEDLFESVGSVSVVDDNFKILAGLDTGHTAFDGVETGDAVGDLGVSEVDEFANADGGEGIIDIEFAGNLDFNGKNFTLSVNIKIISHITT